MSMHISLLLELSAFAEETGVMADEDSGVVSDEAGVSLLEEGVSLDVGGSCLASLLVGASLLDVGGTSLLERMSSLPVELRLLFSIADEFVSL